MKFGTKNSRADDAACYRRAFRESSPPHPGALCLTHVRLHVVYVSACMYTCRPTTFFVSFISFISYWCISGKRCPAAISPVREYRQVPLRAASAIFCTPPMFSTPMQFLRVCALKRALRSQLFAVKCLCDNEGREIRRKFVAIFVSLLYAKNIRQTEGVQESKRLLSPLRFS